MKANPLRDLPSVDALLRTGAGEALVEEHGRQAVVEALRAVLGEARAAETVPDQEGLLKKARALAPKCSRMRRGCLSMPR